MTDRSRHQSNQKTGNARRGNANAGIQAGNNLRNLPLNNAINKIAKTVTKVGTTSVNQVSKPNVDNLPRINTSNVPKSPLERLGLENRASSGGFNYNVKDFQGKTSGTAGLLKLNEIKPKGGLLKLNEIKPKGGNPRRRGYYGSFYSTGSPNDPIREKRHDAIVAFHDAQTNPNSPYEIRVFKNPNNPNKTVKTVCDKVTYDPKLNIYKDGNGNIIPEQKALDTEINNFMKSGVPSDWFNTHLNNFEGILSGSYSITMSDEDRKKWAKSSKYNADFYNASKRIIENKEYLDPKAKTPTITKDDMVFKLYYDKWWNAKNNKWRKNAPPAPVVPVYDNENNIVGWKRTSAYVTPTDEEYEAYCEAAEHDWKIGQAYLKKFNENEQEATEIARHTAGALKGTPDSLFDAVVRVGFKDATSSDLHTRAMAPIHMIKSFGSYFKNYVWNPMYNGRVSTSFYNGLYNFGECLDYFAYCGRALDSSRVNIKYSGGHSYEDQVDWLYSGGYGNFMYEKQTLGLVKSYKGVKYNEILKDLSEKRIKQLEEKYGIESKIRREDYATFEEYDVARRSDIAKQAADIVKKYRKVSKIQKRLFELGAGDLMTPSSRAGIKNKGKIVEAIKNDRSIKGIDLWSEFEQLKKDWVKADKFDKPLSRVGKAYTDFDSDYLPDTGSLAKDTSLYLLTDPSILLTLGTGAAVKVGAKGLGRVALDGIESSISREAYKSSLDIFTKESKYLEKNITTISSNSLSKRADDFAQSLIDNRVINTVDKEQYVNLYYNGFKNMQDTRNFKFVSSMSTLYKATDFLDRINLVGGLYLPASVLGTVKGTRKLLHKVGITSKLLKESSKRVSDNALRAFGRVSGVDNETSILDIDLFIDAKNKEMESSPSYDKSAFSLYKRGAAKDKALINELIDTVVNNPNKLSPKKLKKYVNKKINRGIISRVSGDSCSDLNQLKTVLIDKSKNIGKSIDAEKIINDFTMLIDRLDTSLKLADVKDVDEWVKAVKSVDNVDDLKWLYTYYATNIDDIDVDLEKIFFSRAEFFNSKIKGSPDLTVRPFDMEAFVKFEKQRLGHAPVNKVDKATHDTNLDGTKCEVTDSVPGSKPHVKKLIDNLKDTFRLLEDNAKDARAAREDAGIPFGKSTSEHIIDKPDIVSLLYYLGKLDDTSSNVDIVELSQRIVKAHNALDNDYHMSAGLKDELFKADPAYLEYYNVIHEELPPLYEEYNDLTNRLDDADVKERISLKERRREIRTKIDDVEKCRKTLREQLISTGKIEQYRVQIGTYNRLHSDSMSNVVKVLRESFEVLKDTMSGVVNVTDDLASINVGKNKAYVDYITDSGWRVVMDDIVDSSSDFGMFVADRDSFRELIDLVEEQAIKENRPAPEIQTIKAMYNDLCIVSDQAEAYHLIGELLNNIKYDTRLSPHQKEVMYEFIFESSKNTRFGNYIYKLRDPKVVESIKNQMIDSSYTTSLDLESARSSMTSSVDSLDSTAFYGRYDAEEVAENLEIADEIVKENTSLSLAQYIIRDKDAVDTLNGFVDNGHKVLILDSTVFDAGSGIDAIGSICVREYTKIENACPLSDVFKVIQEMPFRDDFITKFDEESIQNVTYEFLKDYYAHDSSKNLSSEKDLRKAFYDEWQASSSSEVVSDLEIITKFVEYLDSIDSSIKIVVHDPDNKMSNYLSKRLMTASSKNHVRLHDLFNSNNVFNMYDMLRVSEASKGQEVITQSTMEAIIEYVTAFRSGLEGKINPAAFDPVLFTSALNRIKNKIKGVNLRFDMHAALDPEYLIRIESAPEGYAKYYSKEAYLLEHKFVPDITRDRNMLDKMFMYDNVEYSKAEHDSDVMYNVHGNKVNIEPSSQDVGYAFRGTDSEYISSYCPELGRYSEGRRNTSEELQASYEAILASDFVDAKSYDPRVKRVLDRMTNVTRRDVFEANKYRLEKELPKLEEELAITNRALEEANNEARQLRIKAQKRGIITESDAGFWLDLEKQRALNEESIEGFKAEKIRLEHKIRDTKAGISRIESVLSEQYSYGKVSTYDAVAKHEANKEYLPRHMYLDTDYEFTDLFNYFEENLDDTSFCEPYAGEFKFLKAYALRKSAVEPVIEMLNNLRDALFSKKLHPDSDVNFPSVFTYDNRVMFDSIFSDHIEKTSMYPEQFTDCLVMFRDTINFFFDNFDAITSRMSSTDLLIFTMDFSNVLTDLSKRLITYEPDVLFRYLNEFTEYRDICFAHFEKLHSVVDHNAVYSRVPKYFHGTKELSTLSTHYSENAPILALNEFLQAAYTAKDIFSLEKFIPDLPYSIGSCLQSAIVLMKSLDYYGDYFTFELKTAFNEAFNNMIKATKDFIKEASEKITLFNTGTSLDGISFNRDHLPDFMQRFNNKMADCNNVFSNIHCTIVDSFDKTKLGEIGQTFPSLSKAKSYFESLKGTAAISNCEMLRKKYKRIFKLQESTLINADRFDGVGDIATLTDKPIAISHTDVATFSGQEAHDYVPDVWVAQKEEVSLVDKCFTTPQRTIVSDPRDFDYIPLTQKRSDLASQLSDAVSERKEYSTNRKKCIMQYDRLQSEYESLDDRLFNLEESVAEQDRNILWEVYDSSDDEAIRKFRRNAGTLVKSRERFEELKTLIPEYEKQIASLDAKLVEVNTVISNLHKDMLHLERQADYLQQLYNSGLSYITPKVYKSAEIDPLSFNKCLEFSKRFDKLVNKLDLNVSFLSKYSDDFKTIILLCRKFASQLDVTHPYHYLSELKVPETLKEQYAMARILYEIVYAPLKMSKEQQSKQFLNFIDNLSAERRASLYTLNIKGSEFNDEIDNLFPNTWLFDGEADDLIFKAKDRWTKESNIGMADWQVLRLDDPEFILANVEKIRQESNVYDTWASRLGNGSTSSRDRAVRLYGENLKDLQVLLANSYEKAPESFRLYRKYLDTCQKKMVEAQSLQVMEYISGSVDNLINHLLFHNQLLVVSKNGSNAYLSYLAKLDELFKDAPDILVRKETDEFMFISLSRDTQLMVNGDERILMYKGELYNKVYSEKDLTKHYKRIELPEAPEGCEELYKMLKNCYDNLDYLTDGAIRGSVLIPHTQARHQALWRKLPKDFKQKIIKGNATYDNLLFNRSQFDFSLIGDVEHSYKVNTYDDTDILHNLNKCYEDLVGTISTERMYIANFFDENCHSRLVDVLKGLTDEEQLQVLKDLPDQCVVTLREGSSRTGFNVHKLKIRDAFDLERAKLEKAIIVPYDIYVEMTRLINQSLLSKTYLKVWAQLVFFLKVGHLCNPGTWMRNWVDATIKASGETGSVGETALGQLQAMRLLHDYNSICKVVKKLNGDYMESLDAIERGWSSYQLQAKVSLSFEEFQFLESWLKVSLSGGESRLLSEFLKRESKDQYSRKNLKIGDTRTVQGRVAAQNSFDVVGGDIPRFEALGQDEILHLIELCEKDGRQKYKLFDESFTKEMFLDLFNKRLSDVDYQIEEALFNKYITVVDTLLRKRNILWSKTPRGAYNSIDHLCSMCLKPMSKIEQVVRLGQYLTLESKGYTKSQIFKSIADTQFEYQLKSTKLKYAELVVTYANFEIMNMKYWLNQFETNPSFIYTLGRMWGGLSWEPCRSYTLDEEYYNNKSIMYMMTHGAIPIGNKGLYLKMFPSALGSLNWFFGLPSQYMQAVIPPLETLSKDLFYLTGGAFANVVEDTDFDYADQEVWEKILNSVPIAGTIYTRYIQHFMQRKPWLRLPEGSVGSFLAKYLPTVFGAAAIYNRNEASSFEDFQRELAKQGKWYDCNLSRVVPLSQKNNIGLNKDVNEQTWEEFKQNMFKYKGQLWDQNWFGFKDGKADYGHFTSFDNIYFNEDGTYKERGLNQMFDFSQEGAFDAFTALEWEYHGRKWDNNTRKFISGNLWRKDGLNKDFDFKNDPNAWYEWNYELNKHGYYYDMKTRTIKKLKEGEEWHLNQFNRGYYHRGWREFNRWLNYGNKPPADRNKRYRGSVLKSGNRLFNTAFSSSGNYSALRMATSGYKTYDEYYKFEYNYNYSYRNPNARASVKRYNPVLRNRIYS